MTEPRAAVVLDRVTKRFDDVVAVDAVDLEIADGEFFSLLGPSGCGKTTTLRMIAGLEYPTAGRIRIFGEEMGTRPPNERPVNTVFQSYALFPHLTVARNVAFGLEMRGVDRDDIDRRVADAIDLVQLTGREGRRPSALSGGQQQRVALARALVNHPKVLLLDEPLGALDLKLRQAMQLELKAIQERVGITFVYVTHDQEEALTMSDRIGVMDGGRLLQVGTPEAIYSRPRTRFVADFIGDTNLLAATVRGGGRFKLADGTLVSADVPAAAAPDGDAGDRREVTLAIRPERLALADPSTPATAGVQRLDGVVDRVTFLGNARTYEVVCAGERLVVRQGNQPGTVHAGPDDRVAVTFEPSAVTVLDD